MRTSKNERAKVVSDMANYMLNYEGNCTRDVLLLQFSPNEVDTYSAEARTLANSLSQRAA